MKYRAQLRSFVEQHGFLIRVWAVLLMAACCLMLPRCHRRTAVVATAPVTEKSPANTAKSGQTEIIQPALPDAQPARHYLLMFQKTGCYGSCPVFEVRVHSDQEVEWLGKRHVERLGMYRAFVSKEWIEETVRHAQEQGFFNFSARYPDDNSVIEDIPHTITTVQRGAVRHTIDNGGNAPLKLRQLESYLLERFDSLEWKKVR